MAKIITMVGACSSQKRPLGFQFALQGDTCALVGSYSLGATAVVSSEPLTGTPVIGEPFRKTGCRICGNKQIIQCGSCKKFICYDGSAKRDFECPLCGSCADVPASADSRIPRTASIDSPYTKWASTNDIPAAPRDAHGNPQGSEYDLAKDGSFKKYSVIAINLCSYANFIEPEKALKRKGFEVSVYNYLPAAQELRTVLSVPNSQLWVISSNKVMIDPARAEIIRQYYLSGHGVYIFGDNAPWFGDANVLLQAFYGAQVRLAGDYSGEQILSVQKKNGEPGIIANHLISTGIVSFYEGVTIAHLENIDGVLRPLAYSSDRKIVTAYENKDGRRVLVDGGFTRLYHKWNTAGTERLVVNAAAWLANVERFGYQG